MKDGLFSLKDENPNDSGSRSSAVAADGLNSGEESNSDGPGLPLNVLIASLMHLSKHLLVAMKITVLMWEQQPLLIIRILKCQTSLLGPFCRSSIVHEQRIQQDQFPPPIPHISTNTFEHSK